jgi:thymidylate synthase ThyX
MPSDYQFEKKPRRMTDPPQNKSHKLEGYEGVEVKLETDPARIAYFAREATWGDIMREPSDEEMAETLAEVAAGKVLGAAKEVPALGFRIKASRSTMDQMLRLRESAAGAQTTRDNDQRNFNIIVPNTIVRLTLDDHGMRERVGELVEEMRRVYGELVDAGVPPQDARYVALPLGFQTQWIQVLNMRALEKMCEQRLCNGLTQHETNYVVRVMRDLAVEKFPDFTPMFRSGCEKRGECSRGTMLFPPCGAFGRVSSEFDPEKHLYPAEANDAMQFALWDRIRQSKRDPLASPFSRHPER